MVLRGIALLLPGEVDPDHQQALLAAQPRRRARDLEARGRVDLALGGLGQRLEEAAEAQRELGPEEAHRAEQDAGREAGRLAARHLRAGVEGRRRPPQAAVHRAHDRGHLEAGPHVELRREAHLDVAHAVVLAVLGQLERGPLERLVVLEDTHRVAEPLEVLGQARVARRKNQRFQALRRLRGKGDLALAGELDQGAETQRPVEVHVQVRLREAADELAVHRAGIMSRGLAVT